MTIPLVDLQIQYRRVRKEVEASWRSVLDSTSFVLGSAVTDFEHAYSKFCDLPYCVGVANGGDAIELLLRALRVSEGDEVIVPANTFAATAMAVAAVGAVPVLVDCDPAYHLIDPDRVEDAISPRTRAVIPVHLFGQMAPMEEIASIARDHSLVVIEDGAQSQGATQHGRHAGTLSDGVAVSFYPGKNLGAFGDAGGVLTRFPEVDERVRKLRNYGGTTKYEHTFLGRNSRLDSLQAAVLSVKLRHLNEWNLERSAIADHYELLLSDLTQIRLPKVREGNAHVWHLYVVEVSNRDACLKRLHDAGIMAGVHYPESLDMQAAFAGVARVASSENARKLSSAILSLPIFPGMTTAQVEQVADVVRGAVGASDSDCQQGHQVR